MSAAIQAKTAKARALIAVKMIKTGNGLHDREFDDCFEMGDGNEVMNHLIEMTRHDYVLATAMKLRCSDLGTPEANVHLLEAIKESLSNPIMNLFNK